MSVFDGLNIKIMLWQTHAIHTIKKYGLQAANSNCHCEYRKETSGHKNETRTYMVIDLSFDDYAP